MPYQPISSLAFQSTHPVRGGTADLWWVGDYSDKTGATNGGFMAIHLKNALSTGGFSVKTANKSKGQYAFTYTSHYSMEKQDEVPFEVYIKSGTDEAA